MDNNIYLAVYGTLRKGFSNNKYFLKDEQYVGTGLTLEEYQMTARSIPFVNKNIKDTNIVIDLFKIPQKTLLEIDRLEGHPDWYKREEIPVKVNNEIYKAWLYFSDSVGDMIIKSGDYSKYKYI